MGSVFRNIIYKEGLFKTIGRLWLYLADSHIRFCE